MPQTPDTETHLLQLIADLSREMRGAGARPVSARLDSSLEADLGLDSLARAELLMRIERAFACRLGENTLATAETPRDFLKALTLAVPSSALPPGPEPREAALEQAQGKPETARTLVEVLQWHAAAHPDRPHILFYRTPEETETLTYGALLLEAGSVAAGLLRQGIGRGEAVAIMLPTCLDFFRAFYGILLAGGVPVPLYPPARPSQVEEHLRRQGGILRNCGATMLITSGEIKPLARLVQAQVDNLERLATVPELRIEHAAPPSPEVRPGDTAFLQYTSGSTGNPKGVVLSHANLLANIRAWSQAVGLNSEDVCVSWLPLYHDMGLIGTWLGSLYNAGLLVLMSPVDFLARPERWLWAIHHHRGTITAAPNFAFELCLRRLASSDFSGLDLSSWRFAGNGAEPVSAQTLRRFRESFAPFGFDPRALNPVYGLAENSVGLAIPPLGRGPLIDRVARERFMNEAYAQPADEKDGNALEIVACGRPLAEHEVRVVDASDRELAERRVGRLQFRGPSATAGYLGNPEENQRLFCGNWLNTGDLGYMAEGEIYLTGRAKDMIIRGGQNIYPYELEEAIGNLPGIRKGCVAVFGVADPGSGTERLVAVAETREGEAATREALCREINEIALSRLGMPVDDIVLTRPQGVLKTSSGKIRRAATRDLYLTGMLGTNAPGLARQMLRLTASALAGQSRRQWQRLTDALYSGYVWSLFAILGLILLPALALIPARKPAWALARALGRAFVWLSGTPVSVLGLENLPRKGACVAVSNHASYLDAVLLLAVLPRPFAFVAKQELASGFPAGFLLRRLGTEFIARDVDASQSVENARRLTTLAEAGTALFLFPEGTFRRAPGLRPFRQGAFLAAAEAGVPVIPVALKGTRAVLRDESWFAHRGDITVTVGRPVAPRGKDWEAAMHLSREARSHILASCGEPDLMA
ncbi:MAG: AMP-binding protein [Rhodocyclaceae bacterium]|nr:AMP-binding protein [Rhodocyclaceae bacterium]